MSTHKHIDKICAIAVAFCLLLCLLLMCLPADTLQSSGKVMGYESRLFDTSSVHTIDIQMDDWDSFIASAESEEYSLCTLVIDGETFANVGIRGKGNTSLSTVSSMGSSRYSFKVEFDQYDSSISYHGLDKLSLNNLIQDSTYMKDYLTYRLMNEFGVAAPLCSFVHISVNGESWGLYLAVEGVEDSFLQRSYGSDYGELYKPDSMSFGGGRGNGKDFNMEDFDFSQFENSDGNTGQIPTDGTIPEMPADGSMPEMPSGGFPASERGVGGNSGGMGEMGDTGSSDVLLQYTDDNVSSYSNIFDNAKTDVSSADQARLIASLRTLSSGENIESVVDINAVLRYFVVHNFVVNGDSYTGNMIHNYYLYEEAGVLSMIPWDYNLAYGTFQGGSSTDSVNDDIDSPLSVTGTGRPMIDWIFSSEEYTEKYHKYFSEFLSCVDTDAIITQAYALIAPYVESDPTAFYSYGEFQTGVETLRQFCSLRSESVLSQLSGSNTTIDASHIDLSDMGSMGDTGMGDMGGMEFPGTSPESGGQLPGFDSGTQAPGFTDGTDMTPPEGSENTPSKGMTEGQMPSGGMAPGGQMPQGGFGDMSQPRPGPGSSTRSEAPSLQTPSEDTAVQSAGSLILIPICLILLLAAILTAWKYKR